jgi:hypothetical protein
MSSSTPPARDAGARRSGWLESRGIEAHVVADSSGGPRAPSVRPALEATTRTLAAIERPSASAGERRAAEWIAARFEEVGWRARVEDETAHGGYWWPLGLANGAAALAAWWLGRRPRSRLRRRLAGAVGAVTAAGVWNDVSGARMWWRAPLPRRQTSNVVAEGGDSSAARTLVLVAHHDAAHSGLVFHPALPRVAMRIVPRLHERARQLVPIMFSVWLGPVLTAAAALVPRRVLLWFAVRFGLGAAAAMANIGLSRVVPAANDNACSVAVLLALAEALSQSPVAGVRVLLVSTGSEESFSEGMHAFLRRHGGELPPERTEIVALECLGGSDLVVLEGEGMLVMRPYDAPVRAALEAAASEVDAPLYGPYRTVLATDALVALRRGWRAATLASIDDTKLPRHYHWPNDTADAVDYATAERALAICEHYVRAAAQRPAR